MREIVSPLRGIRSPLGALLSSVSPFEQLRALLFSNGEQGFMPDPSDFSTMFQDAAGTTPVTAFGQPVGFLGDKRLGFTPGPELVTNGDFSAGATGWTLLGTASISGGQASLPANGDRVSQNVGLVLNRFYEIRFAKTTANVVAVFCGTTSSGDARFAASILGPIGNYRVILQANNTLAGTISFGATASGPAGVDNISVRELPGNHATQPTAAARPILRQTAGGVPFLEGDGVDDAYIGPTLNLSPNWHAFAAMEVRSLIGIASNAPFFGLNNGNNRAFLGVRSSGTGGASSIGAATRENSGSVAEAAIASAYALNERFIHEGHLNGTSLSVRKNGGTPATATAPAVVGTGTAPMQLFTPGAGAINFFGGFWIDRALPADQALAARQFYAQILGVTL